MTEHRPSLKIMKLDLENTQFRALHEAGGKVKRGREAKWGTTATLLSTELPLSVLSRDSDSLQFVTKFLLCFYGNY